MIRFGKTLFIIFIFAYSALAQMDSLMYGGIWRTYLLHLPSFYSGSTTVPLLIGLNGRGGIGSGFETITKFSVKADAENFIAVYPDGTGNPKNWNCGGSWLPPPDIASTQDDVGFISTLIDTLSRRFRIDSTRIYVTGFSNGSMMAYRLAAELSNKIAAIAAGSGPMTIRNINPSQPVAVIHFHALDDNIPYAGVTDSHAPVYFPPIETLIATWVNINGCATIADTILNISGVLGRKWTAVSTGADVVLYRCSTGGHAWPIGTLAETDIAWDFLKTHIKKPANSTIAQNTSTTPQAFYLEQNYPNPFNPTTIISFSVSTYGFTSLRVYDLLGREVTTLLSETLSAGSYTRKWNAVGMPSGIYLYRLQAGKYTETKKLILLR